MIQMLLLYLIGILCIYGLKIYAKWYVKFHPINKIPGPKSYPLIGNVIALASTPRNKILQYFNELSVTYGPIFRLWFVFQPVVIISKPEHVQIVLSSQTNIQKSLAYHFFESWLGTGLLTARGKKWRERRKLLTPAFHFSVLESFLPVINENCKMFIERLKSKANGPEFNIYPFISECALDIICETSLGVTLNIQKNERPEYLNAVSEMAQIIVHRALRPWLWTKHTYRFINIYKRECELLNILHKMSISVIQRRREERKASVESIEHDASNAFGQKKRKAFLDILLDILDQSKANMSLEDIREEVDTFMFEGHDTISSGLSTAMFLIATHPTIQDKIAEELYSVFSDSDRSPTHYDLCQLLYLDCAIKESMRIYPPVPLIARRLDEDIVIENKFAIPTGSIVQIHIHGIHHQAALYPDPDQFNPDNFLPENCLKRHPFAYVPFSAGPRNCIGQKFAMLEEKIILSSLLRKFEIQTTKTKKDLILTADVVLRPCNGVFLQIKPRDWSKLSNYNINE